ncbi:GNAT family N-acetyltransferase [Tenacibaculum aquimarinum]|uniref:GNAT family N-acetyltransferase n=1 Tax=Tenacibaculum aquimarinum TaxID=2910675 RepID=UPI001F0B4206|nr:GNAT family N-acetyltransferase [Tenacibaculum aquimarinum]MCH3884623.1 GNAT family N-acetyltransferase [Tenacibaculum aquimarinum]
MEKFKVLNIDNSEWKSTIDKSINYDFYHTLSYNKLEKEGEPLLLVASINENFIALPIVIRPIPNTSYFDCTSVYGYSGPVSNLDSHNVPVELKEYFQESINNYFFDTKIVSVFSRLHPIFNNNEYLKDLGEIVDLNKTIAIDLNTTIEEQKKQYRKSNKYEINKLKKNGFEVVEAKTQEEIDAFINIYYETMKRVEAKDSYFFSKQYFYDFLNNDCFTNKLLLSKKDNQITAGAIFTITNKIMQYHLAGTKQEFARDTPMKLILDEARLLANDINLSYLHLGGGVGGSDQDPLFRFKTGFSKNTFQFKVWKYIVNQEVYNQLIKERNVSNDSSFFPLYRA